MLTAAALAGSAVFGYNRENFQFDKKQTLEREGLRWGMQLKRFQLFRDDVRDLVNLTVDRMDVYHLIGALFMKFCIIVFCKGRIQASAPPFVLHLFQLSNACAFLYLLLAVWLSMHASIASHSFGVKMLTRFVRLPIPTQNQILALKAKLVDFEQQGVANMLRLPFQDHKVRAESVESLGCNLCDFRSIAAVWRLYSGLLRIVDAALSEDDICQMFSRSLFESSFLVSIDLLVILPVRRLGADAWESFRGGAFR
ncbi:unnamed protein product [Symbiodinium natans]|uniref:Uncharacterized protein n=1 Tax=Symbiodinium natans TaxID=878477 RepID=A0A812SQA8_9DINO|nr:unnamed protein product [Symbiodinium natans]